MNIVLLEPEIPYNTGNIGRTCAVTNSSLHLIGPLGFSLDEKYIRRSGLDYWKDIDLHVYDGYEAFLESNNYPQIVMATTKARKIYTEMTYKPDGFIMFGKESAGIPEELLKKNKDCCVRIPMRGDRAPSICPMPWRSFFSKRFASRDSTDWNAPDSCIGQPGTEYFRDVVKINGDRMLDIGIVQGL